MQRSRWSCWIIIPRGTLVIIIIIIIIIIIRRRRRRRRRMFVYSSSSSSSSSSSPPPLLSTLSTSSSSSSSSSPFCHQVSLASVGQFAVRVLKELSAFHQWGSIENSAQCLFYSFQNKSVFVKGARMESSWQDWHIKVNYVFGSTTDWRPSQLPSLSSLHPTSTDPAPPPPPPPTFKQ